MLSKASLVYLALTFSSVSLAFAQHSSFFISPHVATQGLGLEFKFAPQPGLNFRAGASVLKFQFNTDYTVRAQPANAEVDVDLANAHLMLDVHPFIKSDSFAQKFLLSAGAAYFWKDGGNALATYPGDYIYEGFTIPSEMVGELYGEVRGNKIAPYFGLGFENPLPKKRVNIGFALGAYYIGKPDVDVTGTKFLEDTESDEAEFRDNVSRFRFLPVLQINLNFAL
ncbi:hypothetical protein [Pedobacter immunditicola]|uniref:hypothetical protein n=1 Tax=Pedobacter immunditicola TaxID=3133440 RepID=UPI0030949F82